MMRSILREAWGLPVDAQDPYGIRPDAARHASMPAELSRAFDGARERLQLARPADEEMRSAMVSAAALHAEEPLPFPRLSQYARFWREGVRTDHEDDVRRLGILTGEAVLAAVAAEDDFWLDRAADGLMLLCELSSWCWVAHEEAGERNGWMVPDPDRPVVDLGAAQTLHVLAWADLALGETLEARVPGLRARLRHEADHRVFTPYLQRRDWHWLHGRAHNWTGWIHQHLIAGALFLLDGAEQRERRDAVLALSLAQLDRYLSSFPDDGGIDEGYSYFWNGASRLFEALDLLSAASGGQLRRRDLSDLEVIGELLRFPQRMDLGEGWFVNVADGPARPPIDQPWDVLHRWGRHLGAEDVCAQALARRVGGAAALIHPELGIGRVLTALGDEEWVGADASTACAPLPVRSWLPKVEVLVTRERAGDDAGLALAVKGGHNDEAHNHLDVGSCIVALDGSPVLVDLGQPTYTALTFTERRYEIWTMTSAWHGVPEVCGLEQGVGADFRALDIEVLTPSAEEDHDGLDIELRAAYPVAAGLTTLRRRALLTRGVSEASVSIEDHWQFDVDVMGACDVAVHHIIAGEVLEHRTGLLLVRALSGAVAQIDWDPCLGMGELERKRIEDPLLISSWGTEIHRLRLIGDDRRCMRVTLRRANANR